MWIINIVDSFSVMSTLLIADNLLPPFTCGILFQSDMHQQTTRPRLFKHSTLWTSSDFRLTPDQESFHALLTALCKYRNVEEDEEFMLVNKKLFHLDTEGFNIILNGWCNITKDIYEAKKSLERNVEILYNTRCYFV